MNATHLTTLTGPAGKPLFDVRLSGVAVDPEDSLYLVGHTSVLRYAPDLSPDGGIELDVPAWSVMAEDDAVWVGFDGMIVNYSPFGEIRQAIPGHEQLGRVTAIAPLGDDLAVADATNRVVHRYSRSGERLGSIGSEANTRGFMIPNGALDLVGDQGTGTLLVAHPQKHRVERYERAGMLVDKWGRFGMRDAADFGGCCNPTNIAVAGDGTIAVSEKAPPRIKLFNASGGFDLLVEQEVFNLSAKNIGLTFDSRNRLFASDPARRIVEVFQITNDRKPKS